MTAQQHQPDKVFYTIALIAPGLGLGAPHLKNPEESGRLGRDQGSDMVLSSTSSWSHPKPGFPLYSSGLGCVGTG